MKTSSLKDLSSLGMSAIVLTTLLDMHLVSRVQAAPVSNKVIAAQRADLAESTLEAGFGPQSPRNIDSIYGDNKIDFASAPNYLEMNLCNIHFHENAEHRGGEFTTYAGNGDGSGYGTGFKYNRPLSPGELSSVEEIIGKGPHGDLKPGDTIEIHFVHSSAQVSPGPSLGSCMSEAIQNPQLRVEALVAVLVNDKNAADLSEITEASFANGLYRALRIPDNLGVPVTYSGSTTGPSYNKKGSPFQVTWNVRPKVLKLNILSVPKWLKSNVYNEKYAHGVRNLVLNMRLLSHINDGVN